MWAGCAAVQIISSSSYYSASTSEPDCPPGPPSIHPPPTNPLQALPPPIPPPGGCVDFALPGNWGADGLHTCATYEAHGGSAYCAHAEIAEGCCFCGGGGRKTPLPSPSAPPVPASISQPRRLPRRRRLPPLRVELYAYRRNHFAPHLCS